MALRCLLVVAIALAAYGCDSADVPPPPPAELQGAWSLDAGGARLELTFDGYDYRRARAGTITERGRFGTQPVVEADIGVGDPFVIQFDEFVSEGADDAERRLYLVDAELENENVLVLTPQQGGAQERFVRASP